MSATHAEKFLTMLSMASSQLRGGGSSVYFTHIHVEGPWIEDKVETGWNK